MGNGIYAKVFAPQKLLRRLGNGFFFSAYPKPLNLSIITELPIFMRLRHLSLQGYPYKPMDVLIFGVQAFDKIETLKTHDLQRFHPT
jgi:hypothetical protein